MNNQVCVCVTQGEPQVHLLPIQPHRRLVPGLAAITTLAVSAVRGPGYEHNGAPESPPNAASRPGRAWRTRTC